MATSSASVEEARELVAVVDDDASVRRSMDRLVRPRITILCENPLVIAREDPGEFIAQFDAVFAGANRLEAMSRSGVRTARQYAWQRVLERHLLPCIGVRRTRRRRAPRRVREETMKALVHTGPSRPRSQR